MAEEYDDFDYIPDDLEEENDHQEKKIEESNRENKNKYINKIDANINLKKTNTDDEYYNLDEFDNKKFDMKNNINNFDEDVEEIRLDDINGESDYKTSQKNPTGRVENYFNENNNQKKLVNKIKNISSIPLNDNYNSSSQTNQNNINLSSNELINNNKYYNNSSINKDIYQANEVSRLETYNDVSTSNVRYNTQNNDNINLSHISQTRTPKNVNSSKHYSYMNIGNNQNTSKQFESNFGNESHISNNNRNYYSQIKGDKNKSYLDSMKRDISPFNQIRKGQSNIDINNYNYNINNNSYISYKMPSVIDMNSRIVRMGSNNIVSKLQYAEMKYDELKNFYSRIQQNFSDRKIAEIENNSTLEKQKVLDFISKHNYELLKYIDNLNKIINIVIDASKVPIKNTSVIRNKKYPPPYNSSNINEVNNNKLLEVFRKEHLKLDHRFKQISDQSYEEKLEETLAELKDQINFYETENKKLKISQKQSEALFERQYKNNNLSLQSKNLEINKVNIEYENTRRLNENVLEKIQKNKIVIADNEQKINELNDWLGKLETIAKEMYGITDFLEKENIKKLEKAEKQKNDLKLAMKKKTEVLEKVLVTNKKKYEGEIIKNEKTIVNLEKQKMNLMRQIKEKSEISKMVQKKVRQLYSHYDNSLEIFNMNYSDNGEEVNLPNNQEINNNNYSNNNEFTKNLNLPSNLPRNDQNLENDDTEINLVNNPIGDSLRKSQNNTNQININNNNNLINLNNPNNSNIMNSCEKDDQDNKINLMNGRITIENENIINSKHPKQEIIENLEMNSQIGNIPLDTQNKKSNKPNFKFNVNLNQLNNNSNNKNYETNSNFKKSINQGDDKLNNIYNSTHNNEKRENLNIPFRINSTTTKNDIDNNEKNSLILNSKDINNGSIINNLDEAAGNNSEINRANYICDDASEQNNINVFSRRRNIDQQNNKNAQNETNYSKNDKDKNKEINKNFQDTELKNKFLNNNSYEKIPSFLTGKNNNTDIKPENIEEIKEINRINDSDINKKQIENETRINSSTNLFNLEGKREKMIGKEKRNILQNMFSDENDDVINLGEDKILDLEQNINENKLDEKRKKDFDNLFKEDNNIAIPNNRFKLQMNKGIDSNVQKRSINNENDNLNNINNIRNNEKPKNILDELEDIVL